MEKNRLDVDLSILRLHGIKDDSQDDSEDCGAHGAGPLERMGATF
ncbi:MAG: hypothetical protein AAFW73_17740 [Bacteroidota bacterium]